MAERWIIPERIFDAGRLHQGKALSVTDGHVTAICDLADVPQDRQRRHIAGVLAPGFVDVQVNGGGGVLFNNAPDPAGISAIIAAHRRFGTVMLMPTVITDAPTVLDRAAQAAIVARDLPGFAGLHIEGPHIAAARRGTHAAAQVRPFDDTTLQIIHALRQAKVPVMMTLAPEVVRPDQIADLTAMGVIVALGHSDATAAQAQAAFAAGAATVTHLFNAMSQMQGRAPGLVGAAINSTAFVSVICDGVHVADDMIALACRARPLVGRMLLVSDAMATVGGPDHFDLYGQTIRLQGDRLVNADGNLAGAHSSMLTGVQRLAGLVGLSLEQALEMAITAPAALLGVPHLACVQGRALTDLIVLDHALALQGVITRQPA